MYVEGIKSKLLCMARCSHPSKKGEYVDLSLSKPLSPSPKRKGLLKSFIQKSLLVI